ncbi:MAG: hypothetical protein HN348_07130 [Proteobacteria bacterium]|nr:hypothetical protein [Pseudomonadota bacterium]
MVRVLHEFYGDFPELQQRASALTRAISLDTAAFLEEAIDFVARVDLADGEKIERETALLGLRIAEADRRWHLALDGLHREIARIAAQGHKPATPKAAPRRLAQVARSMAFGATLAVWASGCDGCNPPPVDPVPEDRIGDDDERLKTDPAPPDLDVVDPPLPPIVVDPVPPPDFGPDGQPMWNIPELDDELTIPEVNEPDEPLNIPELDAIIDLAPHPIGDPAPRDIILPMDPAPRDITPRPGDPPPPPLMLDDGGADLGDEFEADGAVASWRNTAVVTARSSDLPLHSPPRLKVVTTLRDEGVEVAVLGLPEAVSLRWEARGEIGDSEAGDGRQVLWIPAGREDQIRVAVRTHGGVYVSAVRYSTIKTS